MHPPVTGSVSRASEPTLVAAHQFAAKRCGVYDRRRLFSRFAGATTARGEDNTDE
jgi:hypothetical protein